VNIAQSSHQLPANSGYGPHRQKRTTMPFTLGRKAIDFANNRHVQQRDGFFFFAHPFFNMVRRTSFTNNLKAQSIPQAPLCIERTRQRWPSAPIEHGGNFSCLLCHHLVEI